MLTLSFSVPLFDYLPTIMNACLSSVCVGPPGPPSKPEVEKVDGHSVTVTWRRPADDGGSDIIGYSVEKREKKAMRWVRASKKSITELSYEVTGLTEGVEYEFHVLAENRAGVGEPSEPSMVVRTIVAACKCFGMWAFKTKYYYSFISALKILNIYSGLCSSYFLCH